MINSVPPLYRLLQDLGLAFVNDDMDMDDCLVIPYVHIFPVALVADDDNEEQQLQQHFDGRHNLCLVTDLHPRILSTTTVGSQNHHTVMYIGPDSLALVQHYTMHRNSNVGAGADGGASIPRIDTVLDVCTGSGIQALSVPCRKAICVDINPRALQFVKFNAALNGRTDGSILYVRECRHGRIRRLMMGRIQPSFPMNLSIYSWRIHPLSPSHQIMLKLGIDMDYSPRGD
jgi:hypothetical protein